MGNGFLVRPGNLSNGEPVFPYQKRGGDQWRTGITKAGCEMAISGILGRGIG